MRVINTTNLRIRSTLTNIIINHTHSSSSSSSTNNKNSQVIYPSSPIFNRREKNKLRNLYPRPDRSPQRLYPTSPPTFLNRVTMADGSVFHLSTASPRSSISLVRDVTNHPLWNPSLAREVADEDQSGRMGRFARRYAGSTKIIDPITTTSTSNDPIESSSLETDLNQKQQALNEANESEKQRALNKLSFEQQGFGEDDLNWMSGHSIHSHYGIGTAKNIKGIKKTTGVNTKK